MDEHDSDIWTPAYQLEPGTSVFHYTTAAGLVGIVRTGALWATEASGLNDVAEIVEGQRFVEERIETLPVSQLREDLKLASTQVIDANGPASSDVFVLATSLRGDDANQWRLYGAGGRGYCVEVDPSVRLAARAQHELDPIPGSKADDGTLSFGFLRDVAQVTPWLRVLYENEVRIKAFNNLLSWAEQARERAEAADPVDPESGEPTPEQQFDYELSRAVASLTRCIKAPGFSGEVEARILTSFLVGDKHANFRVADHGIIRYFELVRREEHDSAMAGPVGTFQPKVLPIRSIRLGPALNPKLGEPAIRSLLRRHGYSDSVQILGSLIPLR